jgi:hypothetical protein
MYGMVRASCGLCTTTDELDSLGEALSEFVHSGPQIEYWHDPASGMYAPVEVKSQAYPVPESLRFLLDNKQSSDRRERASLEGMNSKGEST